MWIVCLADEMWNAKSYFSWKIQIKKFKMLSAAVVIVYTHRRRQHMVYLKHWSETIVAPQCNDIMCIV